MPVKVTPPYRPMVNDSRDFDPMGDSWGYILDNAPADTWRELVAVRDRRATWPFQVRGQQPHHNGYFYARLSPDWCFLAWGREYVGAEWDPAERHLVRCRLTIARRTQKREGTHELHDWAGVITLDLRDQTFTYKPCRRDELLGVPADVLAEVEHKAGKLLAFFDDAIAHWRAGDQERPVDAVDLYRPGGERS